MTFILHTDRIHKAAPSRPGRASLLRVASLRVILREWQFRRRYRGHLKRLLRVGTYVIEDIGLTAEEAAREIEKPFWRV